MARALVAQECARVQFPYVRAEVRAYLNGVGPIAELRLHQFYESKDGRFLSRKIERIRVPLCRFSSIEDCMDAVKDSRKGMPTQNAKSAGEILWRYSSTAKVQQFISKYD
jgi:hypothetical protein